MDHSETTKTPIRTVCPKCGNVNNPKLDLNRFRPASFVNCRHYAKDREGFSSKEPCGAMYSVTLRVEIFPSLNLIKPSEKEVLS